MCTSGIVVFLVIVLPYFMGAVFNGADMVMAERRPEVEMFLPIIVSSQIGSDMKKETIKSADRDRKVEYPENTRGRKILPQILQEKLTAEIILEIFFQKRQSLSAGSRRNEWSGVDVSGGAEVAPVA